MLKRPFMLFIALLLGGLSFAQQTKYVAHFDTDKDVLNAAEQKKLDEFISSLPVEKYKQIRVTGHTDERASNAYNEDLAKRRAGNMAVFIRDTYPGVPTKVASYGEMKPVASNSNNQGMWENRRVEIYFFPTDDVSSVFPNEGTNSSEKQVVEVTKNTSWDSDWGARIEVPQEVAYDFVEVSDQEGMIKEKMYTMTAEGYLESAYMFCLELTRGSADSILVEVPADRIEAAMSLYAGEGQDEERRWNLTSESKEDYFNEACNCYALWVPPGCYNFDKPLPKSDQLIYANYNRKFLKRKLLWIFPIYEKVTPEFVFTFNGTNSVITPSKVSKNEVFFENVPEGTTGVIMSELKRGRQSFQINQSVVAVDKAKRWKKKDWMSFEKVRRRLAETTAKL